MRMRVGVRQYIVLGALAQMPCFQMYQTDLVRHVNRVAPGTPLASMLSKLEASGFVYFYKTADAWRLTDLGASVLCERRKAETTVFARVSDTIMSGYTS